MPHDNLFDPTSRSQIEARITSLGPGSQRLWGTMELPKMLCHLGDQLAMALGELEVKPIWTPIGFWPFNWILVHWIPFPKNVQTAPELLQTDLGELDAARARLLELIDRFVAKGPDAPWDRHVAFGRLDGATWGRLAWRHLDHHLRQFSA